MRVRHKCWVCHCQDECCHCGQAINLILFSSAPETDFAQASINRRNMMIMNSLSTLITEINPCNKTWEICNGEKWKSEKETKQNRAGGKRYLQSLSMWKQQRRLYTNEWPRMVQVDWGGGRPKDIKFIWSPVEANIDEVPKVRGSTCLCNSNYVSMRGCIWSKLSNTNLNSKFSMRSFHCVCVVSLTPSLSRASRSFGVYPLSGSKM